MIDINKLDKFKDIYLNLLKHKLGKGLDEDELYLAEDYSIVESLERNMRNINSTIELFFKANENKDELAMQAALLRISTFLSGMSGVFEQTKEDIDRYAKIPSLDDFPENYKIPKYYNYPCK